MDVDYNSAYRIYKKMPIILSIIMAVIFIILPFVDIYVFSTASGSSLTYTDYGDYYKYDAEQYYGIMRLKSPLLVICFWWVIGAVVSLATWFFSALKISVIVVRTDAFIEIKNKYCKEK